VLRKRYRVESDELEHDCGIQVRVINHAILIEVSQRTGAVRLAQHHHNRSDVGCAESVVAVAITR
jgi:hypothetical protein